MILLRIFVVAALLALGASPALAQYVSGIQVKDCGTDFVKQIAANGTVTCATATGSGITQLTGAVLAGPGSGSQAATLGNTAVTPGSYTSTDLTVGADGRITAASNGTSSSGGLFNQVMSATPTSASTGLTTWANQGGGSVSDSATGVLLHSTSNGGAQNYRIRYKTAPATPYTIKTLISVTTNLSANYGEVALGWYDGTKLHLIKILTAGGSDGGIYLIVQGYSTVGGASITTFFTMPANNRLPWQNWLQIQDDGTNVHFQFSADGNQFVDIYSVAKSTGYLGASGYTNVFWGINAFGTETYGTLMSYLQTSP